MRAWRAVCLAGIVLFSAAAADSSRPSPPFSIQRTGLGERPVRLGEYRGKVVVLAFIHTTCPHCQDLTRVLIPIAKEYAPRGVQVLECAFNDDAKLLVPSFIAQFRPPFPVGWSDRMAVMSYLQYTVFNPMMYVPHMVFLDRRGIIRGDFPGEDAFFREPDANIRKELEKLLHPAPAARKRAVTARKAR